MINPLPAPRYRTSGAHVSRLSAHEPAPDSGSLSSSVQGPVDDGAEAIWILFPLPAVAKVYHVDELGSLRMDGSGKSLFSTWDGVHAAMLASRSTVAMDVARILGGARRGIMEVYSNTFRLQRLGGTRL